MHPKLKDLGEPRERHTISVLPIDWRWVERHAHDCSVNPSDIAQPILQSCRHLRDEYGIDPVAVFDAIRMMCANGLDPMTILTNAADMPHPTNGTKNRRRKPAS